MAALTHIPVRVLQVTDKGARIVGPDGRCGWIGRAQLPASGQISQALYENAVTQRAARATPDHSTVVVKVVHLTDKGAKIQGPDGRQGWVRRCQLGPGDTISRKLYAHAVRGNPSISAQRPGRPVPPPPFGWPGRAQGAA